MNKGDELDARENAANPRENPDPQGFLELCPTFCQGGVPLTPEKTTYLDPLGSK